MKYHITYSVAPHPEGIEKKAVPADHGACTALIVGSVLYPPDGTCHVAFVSLDGRTGQPISDDEEWKAWTILAKQLSERASLNESKKELCKLVFDAVCAAMRDRPLGEGA